MANNNEIPVDFIKTNSSKLSDVQKEYPGAIIHVHDQNKDDLYIGNCKMTDNFNVGDISDNANTISVGGLGETTIGELKNKSMSQIIMDIVCPLTLPKVESQPSINISYTGNTLIKVGDTLPSKNDIKVTTNQGSFKGGMPYAGELVNNEVTLNMSPDNNWEGTSTENVYTITGTGIFSEGEIPKDSHGNPYQSGQYKGGKVTTNTITITSVYPIWINTDKITEMTERLVDYIAGVTIHVDIPREFDGPLDKFRVNLPSAFSKFTVKQYNSASGKYDIPINMVDLGNNQYIRRTTYEKDTITGIAKYEIELKK